MGRHLTTDLKALQRRVLAALDKAGALSAADLCPTVRQPSRTVNQILEALARTGDVERTSEGLWRTPRRVGICGGIRQGPRCRCGGTGLRSYGDHAEPQWRCNKCDARWDRYARKPRPRLPLDATLQQLARAARHAHAYRQLLFPAPVTPLPTPARRAKTLKPKASKPSRRPRAPRLLPETPHVGLVLQALAVAPHDEEGFTTTGEAYGAYLGLPAPPARPHVGPRRFRDLLARLARRGLLEAQSSHRGGRGRTTRLRILAAAAESHATPAEA